MGIRCPRALPWAGIVQPFRLREALPHPRQRPVETLEHAFLPEHGEQMIEARAGGVAGAGEPGGVDEHAVLHTEFRSSGLEGSFERAGVERVRRRKGGTEFLQARFVLRNKILLRGLRVVVEFLFEIEAGVLSLVTAG